MQTKPNQIVYSSVFFVVTFSQCSIWQCVYFSYFLFHIFFSCFLVSVSFDAQLKWFTSFDLTFEKYLPKLKENMLPLESIRATFDYVWISLLVLRICCNMCACVHVLFSISLSSLFNFFLFFFKIKITKNKKWHLLGIRIYFPFQWVNFGWLRLYYECGTSFFFTRFSTLSGGIRLIFFYCTTFIWYESPMENYFIVHMYFFLWPFFFFTRLFSLALLMWHTNQINSIQFGYLFWYVYIFYTLINCVRNIIHPWHKKYEIIAVSPFQTYVNFLCQKYYA